MYNIVKTDEVKNQNFLNKYNFWLIYENYYMVLKLRKKNKY